MNMHSVVKKLQHNTQIPGWGHISILEILGKYASMVKKDGVILEIGGLFGRSTYTLGHNKDPSVKLITIDHWPTMFNTGLHDGKGGTEEMALFNSKVKDNWIIGEDLYYLWNEFTKDIPNKTGIKSLSSMPNNNFPMIDLLYHDASHEYNDVYNDLNHWFPKLKIDGIIIVDDYHTETFPGVVKAVDQFVLENNLEIESVTSRNVLIRRKSMYKIGFVGLGKLGQECAEVISDKGHFVEGYDIDKRDPRNFVTKNSIEDTMLGKDIIFIAAPTKHKALYGGENPTSHLEPCDFDYEIVKDILTEVNKHATKDQLIVLISTVLPGTTRKQFINLIPNVRFVYNPYLIAMGSISWDMVNPEMVIIGTEDGTLTGDANILINFYMTIMENNPRYEVGTWDEAEAIKIFYNTFISTKIGLVNMIQDVAEKLGNMNVDVVTSALSKSTQRITGPKYMTAGGPDSGSCHPRDNIALRYLSQSLNLGYDLFDAIMHSREIQTKNIALKVCELANDLPVVIVGKAYKPGVSYVEGSGSLLVEHYLNEMKINVHYIDKYTNDELPDRISSRPCLYLLMQNAQVTYCDSPMKDTIMAQEINPAEGSIILDIWRTQPAIKGCTVIHYGNTRSFHVP